MIAQLLNPGQNSKCFFKKRLNSLDSRSNFRSKIFPAY